MNESIPSNTDNVNVVDMAEKKKDFMAIRAELRKCNDPVEVAAAIERLRQETGETKATLQKCWREVERENKDRFKEASKRNENGHAVKPQQYGLTETGNAERFAYQHKQIARYCWEWSTWLVWDETRWAPDHGALIQALAKKTVRSIYNEASSATDDDQAKSIANHAMRSESEKGRKAMLTLAQSEDGIPLTPNDIDKDPWALNCKNGTIDLRTGILQRHNAEDLLTKRVEISFDPKAEAPVWLNFLDRIFERDEELIEFIQRALGYSLTSLTREQCFFILHGSGSNGKSTLLDVMLTIFGSDYSIQCDAELLLAKRHESHTTERADLCGKRFVSVIETGDGRRLAENFIKQMTGGDRIRARRMRQDSFEFTPEFKLWLATNHRPEIRGTDHAIWRRVRLIPFDVAIPDDDRDVTLPEKLKAELPGILTWCVQGCLAWQREGLRPPSKVLQATQTYQQEMDLLAAFLADCCTLDRNAKIKVGTLYETYCEWCTRNGERAESQRRFGQRLTERGLERRRHTGNAHFWFGIGATDSDLSDRSDPICRIDALESSLVEDIRKKGNLGHLGHSDENRPHNCKNCRSYSNLAKMCGYYGRNVPNLDEPICNGKQFVFA